jgi:ABC-type iron transport system FetAB ATPase subunit
MTGTILETTDLQVGNLPPISLKVERGEIVVLRGPSGIGKSRFLRAIADLEPANGTVRLRKALRESMPAPKWRDRVRYVAAEPGWWADTPAEHYREVSAVKTRLGRLHLPETILDRAISELSTGERQRLALLRAMEGAPAILLLDEPTGALDPASTDAVNDMLLDFCKRGGAILLVTHDPQQARLLGSRRYLLDANGLTPEVDGTEGEAGK